MVSLPYHSNTPNNIPRQMFCGFAGGGRNVQFTETRLGAQIVNYTGKSALHVSEKTHVYQNNHHFFGTTVGGDTSVLAFLMINCAVSCSHVYCSHVK